MRVITGLACPRLRFVWSALACFLAAALLPELTAETGPPERVFLTLDRSAPEPILKARAIETGGEWLLDIATDNFVFSAICTTDVDDRPVGHAHVYRAEEKIATAYQPLVALGRLEPGRHLFRIILRAQDHRALVGASGLLHQDIVIEVSAGGAA